MIKSAVLNQGERNCNSPSKSTSAGHQFAPEVERKSTKSYRFDGSFDTTMCLQLFEKNKYYPPQKRIKCAIELRAIKENGSK